jgi:hypothetical protein
MTAAATAVARTTPTRAASGTTSGVATAIEAK